MQDEGDLMQPHGSSTMTKPRILALAGSARSASLNRQLISIAAREARSAGAEVSLIDLRDFPMAIYDGDEEARTGVPPAALALRSLFASHDGVLVATPEHNGSVPALLKNALDWCSRPTQGQDGLAPFRGKSVALLAASPSPFGGIRSVAHLRGIFSKMGANVMADEVLVPAAGTAFSDDGQLLNQMTGKLTAQLAASLVAQTRRAVTP
jgi:chromate reductase